LRCAARPSKSPSQSYTDRFSDQPETCPLPSRVTDSVKLRDGLSYQGWNGNRAKTKSLPP
jgi:hypothetical protein